MTKIEELRQRLEALKAEVEEFNYSKKRFKEDPIENEAYYRLLQWGLPDVKKEIKEVTEELESQEFRAAGKRFRLQQEQQLAEPVVLH
jgi:chromosome segregation ATPase